MENNNFDNKIESSKYIYSKSKERFVEDMTRKERFAKEYTEDFEKNRAQQAQYIQERAEELEERYAQELQYKEGMLGNLTKGKSR